MSFSKVQPSSSGEMSTAQDTLTINTNCSAGYSVYVSATSSGDTNLTNDSAANNNVILPSSATVGSTSVVLSPNTWGINGSSSDVSENKYFGLPTYADATNNALVTKSNVEIETTVPIYYGAKVTTAVAPGTYTGDVLYTVLPSSACTYYTVVFDANGGTGTMDNQTINVGRNTALSGNAFTRSGYVFLGWSNTANGKTGTTTNGIGTMADVDYTDKQEVTDISDFNTIKTLYAIWTVLAGDMQTWTGCPSLSANSIVYLNDTRDNTVYAVKKLPDGKCWMIQNLTIGSKGGLALNASNTNMQTGTTSTGTAPDGSGNYYLPPAGKQGVIDSSSTTTSNTDVDFSNTDDNQARVAYKDEGATDNQTGNPVPENTGYYNYYAASLGFSYYGGSSSGSSPRDICPKGWKLPWTSDAGTTRQGNAEFYTLALAYNNDSSVWTNYIAPGSTGSSSPSTSNAIVRNNMIDGDANSIDRYGNNSAAGFTYAGRYSSAVLYYVGTGAGYWSSSVRNAASNYLLGFNTTNVIPQDYNNISSGFAVRCVAQNNYTVSYNANNGSGAASKASDSIYETGEVTTAGQGTLAKEGYNFLGWSLDQNATTATYSANTAISVPDFITAAGSPASGSTITLYAVWEKDKYTLTVNNGNATAINSITITNNTKGGTISSGASVEWGDSITVACTPKSGYKCTGWTSSNTSLVPNSSNASYTFTMPKGAITLTGNGESDVVYMQGWTCSSSGLSTGQQVTLRDKRDNHDYTVKKLPDGKCWMTQNLTLGDSSSTSAQRTLTSTDTNIDNGTTYYLPPAGKQGNITSSSTLTSKTASEFGASVDNLAKTRFRTKNTSVANDSDTGYYNFYTATLGFSYIYDGKTSGSSTRDICPKGWRLPKTTDAGTTVSAITSVNDFTYLTRQYSTADWLNTATSYSYQTTNSTAHTGIHTGAAKNGNNYAGFSYSGYWTATSVSDVASSGSYWSSSVSDTYNGYRLYFVSSSIGPQNVSEKYYGLPVRCIAKS